MNKNPKKSFGPPLWLTAAAAGVFLLLAAQIVRQGESCMDDPVYRVIGGAACPGLTAIMKGITFFGGVPFMVAAGVLFFLFAWKKWGLPMAAVCGINPLGAVLCSSMVKKLVQRPRPPFMMVEETTFSFPSGHSFSALAFYGFFILLVLWLCRGEKAAVLCTGLGLLILLIGLSRIYLGAHYASDVLAGFCGGIAWLGLLTRVPPVKTVLTKLKEG